MVMVASIRNLKNDLKFHKVE